MDGLITKVVCHPTIPLPEADGAVVPEQSVFPDAERECAQAALQLTPTWAIIVMIVLGLALVAVLSVLIWVSFLHQFLSWITTVR